MGQLLQIEDCRVGTFIYISFSKEDLYQQEGDEGEYLLFLAATLLGWLQEQKDVYLQIKELQLPDKFHRCVLEVYEEIKEDISLVLPQKQAILPERGSDDEVWEVYRDVIYAVTQKKFLLMRKGEIASYKQGNLICEATIRERSDIPKARDLAKQKLHDIGIPSATLMSQLLLISEAITNILKHAKEGMLTIVKTETSVHVIVEDKGPGFPLKLLPNTTLMAGYSTKKSLGQGFTLMMKMSQQVLLCTVPNEGTTLILVFHSEEIEVKI
ncbi:ATP-binding protein [Paenibacillus agricola]|uniref:Anti-sigma regulatory factor n=1 Tax=Paenibacillus agricola TaxID=2716264 RepID=A0ABX0JG13_9BACL|nr:ATP-binding protein [Paenibacillus agricola]NHN35414.1 anti-sigma regulatory factor [Paenibacillus agricola]